MTTISNFLLLASLTFTSATLRAAPAADEQMRTHVERGKASFGLGKFADAAEAYEAAFALKPSPPLLYNAAQAHRMAGHKERALALYQSYLRLYARTGANREESETHVANLAKALADEKRVASAPPNDMAADPEPQVAPARPVPTAPMSAASPEPGNGTGPTAIVARADDTEPDRPLTSKPWFWAAMGGVVVTATVVVLAITLGGSSDPKPTAGTIQGN